MAGSGGVDVTIWGVEAEGFLDDDKRRARERHDEGPVKGVTYTAPADVPGFGLARELLPQLG